MKTLLTPNAGLKPYNSAKLKSWLTIRHILPVARGLRPFVHAAVCRASSLSAAFRLQYAETLLPAPLEVHMYEMLKVENSISDPCTDCRGPLLPGLTVFTTLENPVSLALFPPGTYQPRPSQKDIF